MTVFIFECDNYMNGNFPYQLKMNILVMGEYRNYPEDELRKGVREGKYIKRSVG